MGQPFIFKPPIFMCPDTENPNGPPIECIEFDGGCDSGVLSSDNPNSVALEFGLYCS